jgi:hypothetical protein
MTFTSSLPALYLGFLEDQPLDEQDKATNLRRLPNQRTTILKPSILKMDVTAILIIDELNNLTALTAPDKSEIAKLPEICQAPVHTTSKRYFIFSSHVLSTLARFWLASSLIHQERTPHVTPQSLLLIICPPRWSTW